MDTGTAAVSNRSLGRLCVTYAARVGGAAVWSLRYRGRPRLLAAAAHAHTVSSSIWSISMTQNRTSNQ
eukprot:COSAG01_NODE_991_length_12286_cov_4.629605_10_plen_68_part_00